MKPRPATPARRLHVQRDPQVDPQGRDALVAETRAELERHGWPRLQASLILLASGFAAFLVSVLLLWAGVHSMAARYALASVAGYLVFLAFIRAWIAWQRGSLDLTPDLGDVGNVGPIERPSAGSSGGSLFSGGRSGGAGGGASFDAGSTPRVAVAVPAGQPAGEGDSLLSGLSDADDVVWIVLAVALAFAGLVAVLYVVYAAPLLLAEVALDAAVMSGIYRRLRRNDAQHWTTAVFRRTWIPALVIVVCAAGVGLCAQLVVPEARSIGGVIRTVLSQ